MTRCYHATAPLQAYIAIGDAVLPAHEDFLRAVCEVGGAALFTRPDHKQRLTPLHGAAQHGRAHILCTFWATCNERSDDHATASNHATIPRHVIVASY